MINHDVASKSTPYLQKSFVLIRASTFRPYISSLWVILAPSTVSIHRRSQYYGGKSGTEAESGALSGRLDADRQGGATGARAGSHGGVCHPFPAGRGPGGGQYLWELFSVRPGAGGVLRVQPGRIFRPLGGGVWLPDVSRPDGRPALRRGGHPDFLRVIRIL